MQVEAVLLLWKALWQCVEVIISFNTLITFMGISQIKSLKEKELTYSLQNFLDY